MSKLITIIDGKGDFTATPPTGVDTGDWMSLESFIIQDAGVVNVAGDSLLVEEIAAPAMKVQVLAGAGYIENSDYSDNSLETKYFLFKSDATEELDISSNPSGNTRIDLICAAVDKGTTPDDTGSNVALLEVVEGTPGAGAPAVPDEHLVLAEVSVADGATTITNANITDRRGEYVVQANDLDVAQAVVNGSVLDEPDMASNSATALATQQSIKAYVGTSTSTTSSATPTPTGDRKRNELYVTALTEAAELQAPSGTPANGNMLVVRVLDDGTNRALTYNAIYSGIVDTLPTTTTANKTLYMGFIYNSTSSKWEMLAITEEE